MLLTAFCNRFPFAFVGRGYLITSTEGKSGYTANCLCVVTKTVRVMQWTAIFLLGFSLQIAARGTSQSVTMRAKDVPITTVFAEIEKQTGLVVLANRNVLKQAVPVSLEVKNMPLEEFLQLAFKHQPLEFAIKGNTIVIGLKPAADLNPRLASPIFEIPPITVKGKIVNEKGEPVMASIAVKGTNKGVRTHGDGSFLIADVQQNSILIISGVNIETREITITGDNDLNIAVVTKITAEEEVVINAGYYTVKKKMSTGNIVGINSKEIEKQSLASPLLSLQGRVTGVDVSPNSGAAGNSIKILVRGQSSLRNGGSDDGTLPLYVIDGIPLDSRTLTASSSQPIQAFDPLSAINPNAIEKIEILKDADATAIYGSRGANGVVLITTKKGSRSDKTNLNIYASRGIGEIGHFAEVLNRRQYLDMRYEAFKNDGVDWTDPFAFATDLTVWDTTRSTDWQKALLGKTADITNLQASIAGGNALTNFRLGLGYYKEGTVFPGDFGYDRLSADLSVSHSSADKKLTLGATLNFNKTESDLFDDAQLFIDALTLAPVAPKIYNTDGSLNWEYYDFSFGRYSTWQNPFSRFRLTHHADIYNAIASANLKYQILPTLNISVRSGFTYMATNDIVKSPFSALDPATVNSMTTASANFGKNSRRSWFAEPQLNFSKYFGNHSIDALVGLTFQNSLNETQLIRATGYTSDVLLDNIKAAGARQFPVDDELLYKYAAMYGRIGYAYKAKYLLNLTARNDMSSRFNTDRNVSSFGAAGIAWIFSKEKFVENNFPFISFGKLRTSFGTSGSDNIGDYKFFDTYTITSYPYQDYPSLTPTSLYNPEYRWEKTTKLEAAIELGFLQDRIQFEASWYRNRSSNQLVNYPLSVVTGFPSIVQNLDATIENRGIELMLNARIFNRNTFKWQASVNFSQPKNKLVSFPGIERSTYNTNYVVGEPLTIAKFYHLTGVDQNTGLYTYQDTDDNGIINATDKIVVKNLGKKYYGGLNNTFSIGNFELDFLFQFVKQSGRLFMPLGSPGLSNNQLTNVLSRWQKVGDNTNIQRFSASFDAPYAAYANLNQSDASVVDASFIRLKTISVSYSLMRSLIKSSRVTEARIFVQGQNIFTITNYEGLDPEVGVSSLPPMRIITAGFRIGF